MDCGPSEKPQKSSAASPVTTVPRLPLPPAEPYRGILGAHCKQPPSAGAASPSQPDRGYSDSQSLPHLAPSATKAEKYSKLVEFDCHVLKRPTAYCRNALKNTEQIEAIKTQLQKDLRKLERKQFENELDRELAYLSVHRAALEGVIPLTGPYAPQLTNAKELYDSEVEQALAKYNEMAGDPATTDIMSSEDTERRKELQYLKREVEKTEIKLRQLEEENARLQKEYREEKEIHAVEMARLQEPLPEPDLYEGEPLTAVVEGLQMEIAEQQEKLAREVEKRKTMVPIQVHRQHEQQLRDIQGEKRKLKAQNDLLSQQIESARLEIEATLEQANVSKDAIQKLWTALEEKLSSLSITDKSTPVALADHTS